MNWTNRAFLERRGEMLVFIYSTGLRSETPIEGYSVFLSYESSLCKTEIKHSRVPFSNSSQCLPIPNNLTQFSKLHALRPAGQGLNSKVGKVHPLRTRFRWLSFRFLSGMMWPAEGMHVILRTIGWALPLTQATTAMRCILARGWGITSAEVYRGFLSSSVWLLIFVFFTWIAIRKNVLVWRLRNSWPRKPGILAEFFSCTKILCVTSETRVDEVGRRQFEYEDTWRQIRCLFTWEKKKFSNNAEGLEFVPVCNKITNV